MSSLRTRAYDLALLLNAITVEARGLAMLVVGSRAASTHRHYLSMLSPTRVNTPLSRARWSLRPLDPAHREFSCASSGHTAGLSLSVRVCARLHRRCCSPSVTSRCSTGTFSHRPTRSERRSVALAPTCATSSSSICSLHGRGLWSPIRYMVIASEVRAAPQERGAHTLSARTLSARTRGRARQQPSLIAHALHFSTPALRWIAQPSRTHTPHFSTRSV